MWKWYSHLALFASYPFGRDTEAQLAWKLALKRSSERQPVDLLFALLPNEIYYGIFPEWATLKVCDGINLTRASDRLKIVRT
jgi:hypothetical protein